MFKLKNYKYLLLLMLFAFAGQDAWGGNYSWFNFDVYVKARVKTADGVVYEEPTAGSVYAKLAKNSAERENHEYGHTHPDNASDQQSWTQNATLHAIPNAGFRFLYWQNEDGSTISATEAEQNDGKATVGCNATLRCYYGKNGSSDSNHAASHTSLTQQYGTYSNIFNYYAVFEPISPSIAVKSNNTSLGRALCSKYDNEKGDEVTIKAYCVDYDTKFLGWQVNGEFVSRENPYTFTTTNDGETEGTIIYTAVFENGYNFHRIRNYSTLHYLNAIDDSGSASTLISGGEITSLQVNTTNLEDVMYEAGSIVDIYYARIPNDTRYYYDYFVQGAKASKFYDFDPDDPTSSTGGVFIRMPFDAKTYTNTWAFSTSNEGGMRFTDDNGVAKITMGERPTSQWYIECVDKDLNTKENYFSLDPAKLVQVGNKYYTTLRTSWNILFNPEQMTPYIVKSVDETAGTFEMEAINGNIIPAGTPVIIETSSNVVLDNRMVPTTTAAASGAVPSGNLLQTSTKYFPNQSVNTSSNYKKLMVNNNGQLAFGGSALSSVNGNEAYLCVADDVVLPGKIPNVTLAELLASGDTEKTYNVIDLTSVEAVNGDRLLICKDNNGYANRDEKDDDYIDFMHTASQTQGLTGIPDTYDQSNWIGLRIPDGMNVSQDIMNRPLKGVVGKLTSTVNPEFILEQMPEANGDVVNYTANVYIAASFYGSNHQKSNVNNKEYFFVQPKPMELANVEWAQWNGEKFIVPVANEANPTWNQLELEGEFEFNGSFLEQGGVFLETGHVYEMLPAIVKYKDSNNNDHVYVLGDVNNIGWDPHKGVEMYTTDGNIYTATVSVDNVNNGYGYFSFTKMLGDWDDIKDYRFGPVADGANYYVDPNYLGNEIPLDYWSADTRSFEIAAGNYRLTVNLSTKKAVITPAQAGVPGIKSATNGYVVYPLQINKVTTENNGVITAISNMQQGKTITSVVYYNIMGVASDVPYSGINIVETRYSDGSRTTAKIIR